MITKLLGQVRRIYWMDLTGVFTLSLITLLMFIGYPPEDARRWWVVGIMAGVLAVLLGHNTPVGARAHGLLRYVVQTLFTIALFQLEASLNGIIVLYFVLSAEAMTVAPQRVGYFWVSVWGVLTILFLGQLSENYASAILHGLGAFCGYLFIGTAASAQQRAEDANKESQRLLHELQAAHRQLQEYAARAEGWAVAQERNRLAREVHDTLGHRLTVAAVQLEGAERLMARDPARALSIVSTVRTQVLEGLNELRRTVAALHAPLEHELSLPHAWLQKIGVRDRTQAALRGRELGLL